MSPFPVLQMHNDCCPLTDEVPFCVKFERFFVKSFVTDTLLSENKLSLQKAVL